MQAPRGGAFLGKRKDREYHHYPHYPSASSSAAAPSQHQQAVLLQRPTPTPTPPPPPPFFARPDPRGGKPDHRPAARLAGAKPPLAPPAGGAGNKLLAGYLAHEFLRRGTLLGERRLEAPPLARKEKEPAAVVAAPDPSRRYAEVSRLLMAGGARIPGVVNPSQLGRWLRIKE